ncbi:MAG: O-antigen ligase family protein [Nannocystaceae bacterium]|nr:O-antigen ligase family protein [bacterium]
MSHDAASKQVAWATAIGMVLFFLSGRWSLSRMGMGEASALLEPRAWTVVGLAAIAYSPALSKTLPLEPALRTCLGAVVVFLGYMTATVLWAPTSELPWTKAYEMLLILVTVASVTRIARWTGPRVLIHRFWDAFAVALGIMGLLGLVSWAGSGGGRLAVLGGGPNVFGRNMAVLLMLSLSAILAGRGKRGVWIAAAALAAVLALLSGSRGAIVGSMAGAATLVYTKKIPLGRFVKIAIGLAVFAWFLVTFTDMGQSALTSFEERFLKLTLEERHDAGRSAIYIHALAMGLDAPLVGQGLAAFAVSGYHVYPHNIALEAFCEGGLVGVACLLAVLVPTLRRVFASDAEYVSRDLAVFTVLLVSASFTGDFYDSRGVMLVALFVSMHRRINRG